MGLKQEKQRYNDYLLEIQVFCSQNGLRFCSFLNLDDRDKNNQIQSENEKFAATIENENGKQLFLRSCFNEVGSYRTPEFQIGLYRTDDPMAVDVIFYEGRRVLMTSQRGQDTFPERFHGVMQTLTGTDDFKTPLCSLKDRVARENQKRAQEEYPVLKQVIC